MKKTILTSLLGMATSVAVVTSAHGQGLVQLDNYASSGQLITYGPGANGPEGTGIGLSYTIGLYWALGDITGSLLPDPTGFALPETLGGLQLVTEGTATTPVVAPGYFAATGNAQLPGYPGSGVVTLMVIAYEGSDYASALFRGHSAPFTLTPATGIAPAPQVGLAMPAFSVMMVPEPSIFALAGLGSAAMLILRRRR